MSISFGDTITLRTGTVNGLFRTTGHSSSGQSVGQLLHQFTDEVQLWHTPLYEAA